jgi:hypothetical protein
MGSDMGASNQEKTTQYNKQQQQMLVDKKNMEVQSIYDKIEDRAYREIQDRKAEALGQYDRDVKAYEEARNEARADMKTLAETGQDLDLMDENQKAALFKQAGYDPKMGELVYQALKPKTDWKFEVIGNKVIGYGMGPDGQIKTTKADLGFDVPEEYSFQVLPDGTAMMVPKTLDPSRSLDEQIKMIGAQGQYAEPSDPLDAMKKQLEIQKLQAEITGNGALLPTEKDRAAFNQIVGKYNSSPLIKASDRTIVLKNTIDQALSDPSNGSKQLSLVYSYIQALDTYQSAVREGELSLVNSIDSKVGGLQNYVQQIQNGQVVRPEVIMQIADAAEGLRQTISEGASQKEQVFASQARVNGIEDAWNSFRSGFSTNYDEDKMPLTPYSRDLNAPGLHPFIKKYPYKEVAQFVAQYPDATEAEIQELVGFKSAGNASASNVKGYTSTASKLAPISLNATKVPLMYKEGTRPTAYGAASDQCGYYVRNIVNKMGLNYPALGDGLNEKIAAVKKYGTSINNARVGSVIVTKENPTWGHVAYIIGRNAQGFIVSESNFKQSNKISHGRIIPYNSPKIVGVINPTKNV